MLSKQGCHVPQFPPIKELCSLQVALQQHIIYMPDENLLSRGSRILTIHISQCKRFTLLIYVASVLVFCKNRVHIDQAFHANFIVLTTHRYFPKVINNWRSAPLFRSFFSEWGLRSQIKASRCSINFYLSESTLIHFSASGHYLQRIELLALYRLCRQTLL